MVGRVVHGVKDKASGVQRPSPARSPGERIFEPGDRGRGGRQRSLLRWVVHGREIAYGRPEACVFDVATEFFEPIAAVRTDEDVDAPVRLKRLDAVDDDP